MRAAILVAVLALIVVTPRTTATTALRVCADPNNLPFSNHRGEGFENRLAEMLAREMATHVEYVWRAQRRGFLRETLNAGACDVVMGYAAGAGPAQTTTP
jgi:mxaJ protein